MKKTKIFGQFLTEILFISLFSFIGSFYLGRVIAKFIGNTILRQVTSSIGRTLAANNGTNLGGGADAEGFNKMITELNVTINPGDMKWVVIMGIIIITIAVAIASYKLLAKRPKELLSDID